MHYMIRILMGLLVALCVSTALADGQADAAGVASSFRFSMEQKRYERIWDSLLATSFKQLADKQAFVANLRQGQSQLGAIKGTTLVSQTLSHYDPATNYTGDMYTFDYRVQYEKAAFFERVVVIKDTDGSLKVGGIWASPAP